MWEAVGIDSKWLSCYSLSMTSALITSLIIAMAPVFNINPMIAVAVATVESDLNPKAIGGKGEVGLFQIMPQMYKRYGYTRKQMEDPVNNIYLGLVMLQDAKRTCVHKGDLTFLVCYNAGPTIAKRIKNPQKFAYIRKIKSKLIYILSTPREK